MVKIILFLLLSIMIRAESFIPVIGKPYYIAVVTWDHVSDSRVIGYKVKWGRTERYESEINVGPVNAILLGGLAEGVVYNFSVTYVTKDGESMPSKNVSFSYTYPLKASTMFKDVDSNGKEVYNLVVEEKPVIESIPKIKLNAPAKIGV